MEIKESNRYWKLIDLIDIENGITKLPRNYKINGNFEFLDYKNVYNKETVSDFKLNNLPKINIFEKDIKKFYNDKKDCIVVTWSSETNYDIFQACYIETDKPFVLNGFSKIMKIKDIYKDKILPRWLTWYLNFDLKIQKQRESIPYTTRCNMNKNELKNIRINFCDVKEQQEIINIIEPKEDLFLKYHSIIDISNLDAFKKSWYNLINIIEPFEKLRNKFKQKIEECKILKFIFFQTINKYKTTLFESFNFISSCKGVVHKNNELGNYRYFNCSSNISFSFDSNNRAKNDSILITTRGTITSHFVPKNKLFYSTNNIYLYEGKGINCFHEFFLLTSKNFIEGTAVPMLTKAKLNKIEFPFDSNVENILSKINKVQYLYWEIENKLLIVINKLIELYVI